MQSHPSPSSPDASGAGYADARNDELLPPSIAIRCGASETAAIIRLLEHLPAARQAIEAWDGVSRDQHQRTRWRYARLLADLFERHPEPVLAGLRSPHVRTRLWIALAIAEAPAACAIAALEHVLAEEDDDRTCKALLGALSACRALAGG